MKSFYEQLRSEAKAAIKLHLGIDAKRVYVTAQSDYEIMAPIPAGASKEVEIKSDLLSNIRCIEKKAAISLNQNAYQELMQRCNCLEQCEYEQSPEYAAIQKLSTLFRARSKSAFNGENVHAQRLLLKLAATQERTLSRQELFKLCNEVRALVSSAKPRDRITWQSAMAYELHAMQMCIGHAIFKLQQEGK